jgi:hypothetical protein
MRFWTSGFFHESVSPKATEYLLYGRFVFLQKFAEIFTAQGAQVLMTLMANAKNLQSEKF